ncbi:MAG: hypothetical protein ACKVQU_26045 [Burkholderiales bacterium]
MSTATLSWAADGSHSAAARRLAFGIAIWFLACLAASFSNLFSVRENGIPWPIGLAVALPVCTFLLFYAAMPNFRNLVLALDLRLLVLVHTWRFVGVSFLFLAAHGVLPMAFAIPAGVGDAMVAVGALFIGMALYSREGISWHALLAWNTAGLLDFVVTVGIGMSARSGGILHAVGSVPTDAMEIFPLSLIPGFFVPLFIITHLIVFLKVRHQHAREARIQLVH